MFSIFSVNSILSNGCNPRGGTPWGHQAGKGWAESVGYCH